MRLRKKSTDSSEADAAALRALAEKYGRWTACIWRTCAGVMFENTDLRIWTCGDCRRIATTEYMEATNRIE